MLVVSSSVRVINLELWQSVRASRTWRMGWGTHGVHGYSSGLGPVVLLGLGLVVSPSGLEHGLVNTS